VVQDIAIAPLHHPGDRELKLRHKRDTTSYSATYASNNELCFLSFMRHDEMLTRSFSRNVIRTRHTRRKPVKYTYVFYDPATYNSTNICFSHMYLEGRDLHYYKELKVPILHTIVDCWVVRGADSRALHARA